jgi:chemosensory pili system protein ChpC
MAQRIEELYSLLIPLNQNRLIVPRNCVAEVVRYTQPEKPPDSPAWLQGFVPWNDLRVPVVCFEELCGLPCMVPGGRTRIAIFNSMAGKLETGYLGILTEGFPQLVRVNRDVMELDDQQSWPEDGPVICQIKMINEYPLVPDIERVEEMIEAYLVKNTR